MGLLDDAIREHLELKRRRGADPAEVEKEEREALGPVRGAAPAAAEPEPEDLEEDLEPVEEPAPPRGAETIGQPTEQFSAADLDAIAEEDEEPPPPPPARPEARSEPPAGEDVVPPDADPEGEDVLDETPEFLQEAPEHDRLWFEQKPPRDFDF
jgi:hypothetical protein